MTRSTLKTLWLMGGGLLATWFAVAPEHAASALVDPVSVQRPAVVRQLTSDDLSAQEAKLRQHLGSVPLRPAGRNPFHFASTAAFSVPQHSATIDATVASSAPPVAVPALSLSGIAERKTPDGATRTAIVTGDGQLYLVTEGELVGGRYRVVRVESDAVVLRDEGGAEFKLVLQ
jgi:hypothetical protein